MHTLTHPVRSTRGLTVSPGARVRLLFAPLPRPQFTPYILQRAA
jgi:hypothetical protein